VSFAKLKVIKIYYGSKIVIQAVSFQRLKHYANIINTEENTNQIKF
jgi:hypothetical protein